MKNLKGKIIVALTNLVFSSVDLDLNDVILGAGEGQAWDGAGDAGDHEGGPGRKDCMKLT